MSRKPRVMVAGTFHFQGSLDVVQTDSRDLTSEQKQEEIREVVEWLSQFKPTKVAVEIEKNSGDILNQNYQEYIDGKFDLTLNEVYQLGFRISANEKLEKIYAIDWMEDIGNKGIGEVLEWAKENQEQLYDTIMDDYLSDIGKTNTDLSIKETLKELNKTKRIGKEHEVYMQIARIGQGDDYIGIDWLRWWYQRNLIMYKNIMDLVENDTDRILVIVGSGHVHLLTQFLSESGLVEIEDLNRLI